MGDARGVECMLRNAKKSTESSEDKTLPRAARFESYILIQPGGDRGSAPWRLGEGRVF